MDDPDRDAIVRRRNRLLALVLGGVTVTGATACACLQPPDGGGHDAAMDSGPQVCLSPPLEDGGDDSSVIEDGGPIDGGPDGSG